MKKEKVLEIALKTSVVLCGVGFISFIIFGLIWELIPENEIISKVLSILCDYGFYSFLTFAVITTLLFTFGGDFLAEPQSKEHTKKIKIKSYDDFIDKISEASQKYEYKLVYNEDNIIIFSKETRFKVCFISILKTNILTEEQLDKYEEQFDTYIRNNYGDKLGNYNSKETWLIPIICVEEESKELHNFITLKFPTINLSRLPVGINLTNKNIYISEQQSMQGKGLYIHLKKHFDKMFGPLIK